MKKLILLLIVPLLVVGCTTKTDNNETRVKELEQKVIDLQSQQASTTAIVPPAPATTSAAITKTVTSKATEKISEPAPASKSQYDSLASITVKAAICPENTWRPDNNTDDICLCNGGYILNNDKNGCIKATNSATVQTQQPVKTNDQICQDSYGSNSSWSGTTNSTGNIICYCKSGYAWNEQRTSCVVTPIKIDDSVIKIAKCEAEKTEQAQMYQRVEDAAKQMTYTNTLKELDTTDPCGNAFTPEAISICIQGHANLARSIAIESYNKMHNENLITIQNDYTACLNQ